MQQVAEAYLSEVACEPLDLEHGKAPGPKGKVKYWADSSSSRLWAAGLGPKRPFLSGTPQSFTRFLTSDVPLYIEEKQIYQLHIPDCGVFPSSILDMPVKVQGRPDMSESQSILSS